MSVFGTAHAQFCSEVFLTSPKVESATQARQILKNVFLATDNKTLKQLNLLSSESTEFAKKIDKTLKKYLVNKKTNALHLEALATDLVIQVSSQGHENFLSHLKKTLNVNSEMKVKRIVKNRLDALILYEDLLVSPRLKEMALNHGVLIEAKKRAKVFMQDSRVIRAVVLNGLTLYAIGMPIYFPRIDFISASYFSKEALELYKKGGLDLALTYLKSKHKARLSLQQYSEKLSRGITGSLVGLYLYYTATMSIKTGSFIYNVTQHTSSVNIAQPIENKYYIGAHLRAEGWVYKDWADAQSLELGRKVNVNIFEGDRINWELYLTTKVYPVWEQAFEFKHNRLPDLSNPSDLAEWNSFLYVSP